MLLLGPIYLVEGEEDRFEDVLSYINGLGPNYTAFYDIYFGDTVHEMELADNATVGPQLYMP